MTKGIEFVEKGIMAYQQKVWHSHHYVKEQRLKISSKQAKQLGYNLAPMITKWSFLAAG